MLGRILLTAIIAVGLSHIVNAQELYPYSEPASNMPSKAIGVRITNEIMTGPSNYRLSPEIMIGHHKNLMSHAQFYFSNLDKNFQFDGFSLYAKYRFLSIDEVQNHFRMAAFAKASYSDRKINSMDLNLDGDNSGAQLGVVATQLIHKLAISANLSYSAPFKGQDKLFNAAEMPSEYINYSLSTGYLLLPFVYKNYKQPNFNLYVEAFGKTSVDNGKGYLDLAPAVQFIINSKTRIDLGYRFQIAGGMTNRFSKDALMIRAEFNFFNALK